MGKKWGALACVVVVLVLAGCADSPEPLEASPTTEIPSVPPRNVITTGQVTAVCTDAVGELLERVGIDVDSVSLAVEGDYLVTTYKLASVTGLDRVNAVEYSSLLQAADNSRFSLSVRNPGTGQAAWVWLTRDQKWSMHQVRTDGGDDRIEGVFLVSDGTTAIAKVSLSVLPPAPWEWQTHVTYANNKHETCPGETADAGWLRMP